MPWEQDFIAADKNLHDLKGFDCGKPSMNEFLARYAIKHNKLGLSRTYVLVESPENSKKQVTAYYTLAASSVARVDIPATQSLPKYPVPVVLLARLAVNNRYQGDGLGTKALAYALRQAANLSKAGLTAYGLIVDVVDVLDDQALEFYRHFELFKPFTNDPMRLFAAMKTLEEI